MTERSPSQEFVRSSFQMKEALVTLQEDENYWRKKVTSRKMDQWWTDLKDNLESDFQISSKDADIFGQIIQADIAKQRALSWQESIDFALGTSLQTKNGKRIEVRYTQEAITDTTPRKSHAQVIETRSAIHPYIEKLTSTTHENIKQLTGVSEEEDPITFQIELGEVQDSDPFVMFYKSIKNGHIPGKKDYERQVRRSLNREQDLAREKVFNALKDNIDLMRIYASSKGLTEGVSYVLGNKTLLTQLSKPK